jgi:hypothetical protein
MGKALRHESVQLYTGLALLTIFGGSLGFLLGLAIY